MQNCILDVVPRGFDRPVRELLAGAGHAVVSAHGLYEQVCERGQGIVGEGEGEGELASAISKDKT